MGGKSAATNSPPAGGISTCFRFFRIALPGKTGISFATGKGRGRVVGNPYLPD
jgi:hypothetical protein